MFVQHEDYVINTNNINYIKVNAKNNSLTIFFQGKPKDGEVGYSLRLNFESLDEMESFIDDLDV